MSDYNEDRLKEYTIEKRVVFKMKGNFYNQEDAIKKAKTCFDGVTDKFVDSIACHSGVTETVSTEDWEVKDCRILVSREQFIENLKSWEWKEFFPNHFMAGKDKDYQYCFVDKDRAYTWGTCFDNVMITKFDKI